MNHNTDDTTNFINTSGTNNTTLYNFDKTSGNNKSNDNKPKISNLSKYRMALLGTNGILRYLETGYIPDDLLD